MIWGPGGQGLPVCFKPWNKAYLVRLCIRSAVLPVVLFLSFLEEVSSTSCRELVHPARVDIFKEYVSCATFCFSHKIMEIEYIYCERMVICILCSGVLYKCVFGVFTLEPYLLVKWYVGTIFCCVLCNSNPFMTLEYNFVFSVSSVLLYT